MTNTTEAALRECPFCGGEAEIDHMRPFRIYSSGKPSEMASVYCRECNAEMAACYEDCENSRDRGELMSDMIAAWNRRSQPSPASSTVGEIARFVSKMEPLGSEFEKVWDDNADELYEGVSSPSSGEPASVAVEAIKTWEQRAEEHPDHEAYCVTPDMIQQRMQEEIDDLRAALSKPTPVEAGLRERIAMVVMSWHHDMGNGDWPHDKVRAALDCINDEHSGDCTKQPWTCMRCDAEEAYRETDQILAALSETQPPRETSTETKESGDA